MASRIAVASFAAFLFIPLAANNIRDTDFKNFSYPWDEIQSGHLPGEWHWIETPPRSAFQLVQGTHQFTEPDNTPLPHIEFKSAVYGDLDGDGNDEAAVELLYETGGTAGWSYLYVYSLERGAPKLLGRLESGDRAAGGLVKLAIEDGILVLDFLDWDKSKGLCCSAGFIRVRYRWQNGKFIETGERYYGDFR